MIDPNEIERALCRLAFWAEVGIAAVLVGAVLLLGGAVWSVQHLHFVW